MPEAAPVRLEQRFGVLKRARRVWAVGAVHGESVQLHRLHRLIVRQWKPLDRIVYLGNLIGRGPAVRETMDELLAFRRLVLAAPGAMPEDVVYLRGSQEEMWHKLLQIQFAADPRAVLQWMLAHGVGPVLEAYGGRAVDALADARHGPLALTRWTTGLRQAMQRCPGHFQIMNELKRAAYTDDRSLLFVHAGADPVAPFEVQRDAFWWGHPSFERLAKPFAGFELIVRGFDPRHPGVDEGPYRLTLDGGAGYGGSLLAGRFDEGALAEVLEAPAER